MVGRNPQTMMVQETHQRRWDMYCHTAPCLLPRWGTASEVARSALTRRYSGIVVLAHHAPTHREAMMAEAVNPGVRVIGGVTLNQVNGGLSPHSVSVHLKAGIRLFSLPTFDAAAHVRALGSWHSLKGQLIEGYTGEAMEMLVNGRVRPDLLQVLDLIAKHKAVLCSGHIDTQELEAVVCETARRDIATIINHPYFLAHPTPAFWGALPPSTYVQFCAVNIPQDKRLPPIEAVAGIVAQVGAHRCMIGSQASASTDPLKRIDDFCLELHEVGLSDADIQIMSAGGPQAFVDKHLPRLL
jgi:hypothetical protein